MPHGAILEPFIAEKDHLYGSDEFEAGFKNRDGETCGITVPLSRRSLERLIFLTERFEPWADNDGTIQCRPQDVDDDIYGEMLRAESVLPRIAMDALIADMIDMFRNEPNEGEDGVLEPFGILRARLQNAMAMVDAEIARRIAGESSH